VEATLLTEEIPCHLYGECVVPIGIMKAVPFRLGIRGTLGCTSCRIKFQLKKKQNDKYLNVPGKESISRPIQLFTNEIDLQKAQQANTTSILSTYQIMIMMVVVFGVIGLLLIGAGDKFI